MGSEEAIVGLTGTLTSTAVLRDTALAVRPRGGKRKSGLKRLRIK